MRKMVLALGVAFVGGVFAAWWLGVDAAKGVPQARYGILAVGCFLGASVSFVVAAGLDEDGEK